MVSRRTRSISIRPASPTSSIREAGDMTDVEANKAVARRYMQAVVDGDAETIESLQHPDVTWWILGYGDMPRADFIASVKSGLLTAERRHVEIITLTAEG